MPAERYFLDHPFNINDLQELKGTEFHHLAHVMRARRGEIIELVNGKGSLAQARVEEILKEKAVLKIEGVFQEPNRPCRLILAQALPKSHRLDFILEKGTELGADAFWLFPAHLSMKKEFFPHQLERARTLSIAAMKQCGRLTLPEIVIRPPLDQWTTLSEASLFFGDVSPEAPAFERVWYASPSRSYPIIFATGPEGGFSEQEVQTLRKQGALGIKLHPNILRTETASLAALSLLSHWMMKTGSKIQHQQKSSCRQN